MRVVVAAPIHAVDGSLHTAGGGGPVPHGQNAHTFTAAASPHGDAAHSVQYNEIVQWVNGISLVNSAAETNLIERILGAAELPAPALLEIHAFGTILMNNLDADTIRFKVKRNGVAIIDTGAIFPDAGSHGLPKLPLEIYVRFVRIQVGAYVVFFRMMSGVPANGTAVGSGSGIFAAGSNAATVSGSQQLFNAAATELNGSTIDISAQWSVASANDDLELYSATIREQW